MEKVKKKMGRPTDNPKIHQTRIRMTEEEWKRLEYCANKLGLTKTEVVNLGVIEISKKLEAKK